MPTENFKSKEAYRKNLAYRHIHDIPMTATKVVIKGKSHVVKHSKSKKRVKIDAAQRKRVARKRG